MIRPLTIPDTLAYQKLRLLSLKSDPQAFLSTYDREQLWPLSYYQNKIRYATQPPIFGVYGIFESSATGYAPRATSLLIATAQLSAEYHPKNAHLANIYDLYVHPDHRHQGLAQKLLNHLIKKAKSLPLLPGGHPPLEQLHLRVNSQNTPAISLYKKLGFTHIGTRQNAVKEPDGSYQDELLFCLQLK